MATKKKLGRPRAAAGDKIAARHSVNYLGAENEDVLKAAALDGERFIGRWIGRVALAVARKKLSGKE